MFSAMAQSKMATANASGLFHQRLCKRGGLGVSE
jgi:hypothetical protein